MSIGRDKSTGREPAVTVIVPTRNRRRFLEQSVADALSQAGVELEVVVVDDASTDGDALAAADLADPRVRVVRHDAQRGVAAARNTGISAARGTWLAFLDDDDRWTPLKLRQQLDAAEASGAPWVYSGALTLDQEDMVRARTAPPDPGAVRSLLRQANPVPGGCSNVVARAEVIRAVGGFDERLALIADWDLWIRLADEAPPACSPELHVGYRLHDENMHIRLADRLDTELDHLAAKHATTLPPARAHPDLLVWHARAYARGGHRFRAARVFARRWRLTQDPHDLRRAAGALVGERVSGALRSQSAADEQALARFGSATGP